MSLFFALIVALPSILLLSCVLIPSRVANRRVDDIKRLATACSAFSLVAAICSIGLLFAQGSLDKVVFQAPNYAWLNAGVYYDSLTATMLFLIAFIGVVIVRYSERYLNGEDRQGRFLRWILFTLGAVMLLIISRNLLMFTTAWILSSFGLHQLLTHYHDRPWAIWAARKKFIISRLGDILLLTALFLTYKVFGSFDYSVIFDLNNAQAGSPDYLITIIAGLLVAGAMTKSAQFPFHTWLPDTMEAPTPVSALMHAGIINAGGFLVIRLSPLISSNSFALDTLAVIGGMTTLLGGVVMLTQTSIKRSLAFSTIAQMGFMMLQCGLGAFSAALLHIVAHSLYKAHAFLNSGSVLNGTTRKPYKLQPPSLAFGIAAIILACGIATFIVLGVAQLLNLDLRTKPGAVVLGLVFTLALIQMIWQAIVSKSWRVMALSLVGSVIVSIAYFVAYLLFDLILKQSVSYQTIQPSAIDIVVFTVVSLGFLTVFCIQLLAPMMNKVPWAQSLYIHAMNGFYIDIPARRLTARFWGRSIPAP